MKWYFLKIASMGILTVVSECLLPKGNIKKYAVFALSVIMTVSLIFPLKEIKTEDFNINTTMEYDSSGIKDGVMKTVRGIKGFENASVDVKMENMKITAINIKMNNGKMLESAVAEVHKEYLKAVLKALYRTENINVED